MGSVTGWWSSLDSRNAKMWIPVRRLIGATYPVGDAKREPQIMSPLRSSSIAANSLRISCGSCWPSPSTWTM